MRTATYNGEAMITESTKIPTTEALIRAFGVFLLAQGIAALPVALFNSFGDGFMHMLKAWLAMLTEPLVGYVLAFHGGAITSLIYGSNGTSATPPK